VEIKKALKMQRREEKHGILPYSIIHSGFLIPIRILGSSITLKGRIYIYI
jgi:hypothetical protein